MAYYNYDKIRSYNALMNIIMTNRGFGKTYGFKDTGKDDGRYSIVVGGNSSEPSKGVSITGNTIANLRGISVNSNVAGVIVSNNVGQVTNNAGASCTVVNNMTI